ncbi:MAG: hypothetical protein Q9204_002744 [Flavoplaca sp. TL-2023a]
MAIDQPASTVAGLYKQAQSKIPATISLPSHWLKSYEEFVTKNATSVGQIESTLRSLTYLIPGRFHEAELASETLHTSTLLLSLYHTSILRRHFPSPSPPSPQTRYTAFYAARSRLHSASAIILQTIQYTELLCEMFFKRRGGEKARWRLVVVLELIKAICRTIMFWVTGRRMVIEGPSTGERPNIPEQQQSQNAEDQQQQQQKESAGDQEITVKEERNKEWNMPRTGMKLPVLPTQDGESITDFLSKRVICADDIKVASQLTPDLCIGHAEAAKSWIQGFAGKLKGKPLLDIVGGIVEDYDYLWGEYYFSTATM